MGYVHWVLRYASAALMAVSAACLLALVVNVYSRSESYLKRVANMK